MLKKITIALALTVVAQVSSAQSLALSETVNLEVPQDQLSAVLYVEENGSLLKELNRQVGAKLKMAFATTAPKVYVSSKGINTTPIYDKTGKLTRFIVRGKVEIKANDLVQGADVLNNLASFMAIESINFEVSEQTRNSVKQKIQTQVAEQFIAKANRMANALGYKTAAIEKIELQDGGLQLTNPSPRVFMAAMTAPDMGINNATTTETLSVTMQGTVNLRD